SVNCSTPSMAVPTWKKRFVPLMARPVPGVELVLIPFQSTVQPTPKRLLQLLCVLLPESVPQFQVPPTSTSTLPDTTVMEPSGFVFVEPLIVPVPWESGRGLAALADAMPVDAARRAATVAAAATPRRRRRPTFHVKHDRFGGVIEGAP